MFESSHNQFNFETSIRSEDSRRVDLVHLKCPISNQDNSRFEVCNIGAALLVFEIIHGFFSEITRHIKVVIRHQEMWETLLDVTLDLVLLGLS